ncbi:MAG: 6-phosphofructokinase, partial [Planctomycetota bacterium]
MLRCVIATLGNDAPGVNAAVRAVTRLALNRNLEVYGAKQGWLGLLEGKMWKLKQPDVDFVLGKGGSVLGSTDYKIRPDDNEAVDKIAETLKKFDLAVVTG